VLRLFVDRRNVLEADLPLESSAARSRSSKGTLTRRRHRGNRPVCDVLQSIGSVSRRAHIHPCDGWQASRLFVSGLCICSTCGTLAGVLHIRGWADSSVHQEEQLCVANEPSAMSCSTSARPQVWVSQFRARPNCPPSCFGGERLTGLVPNWLHRNSGANLPVCDVLQSHTSL
jgi:hypothetical protein